MPNTETSQPEPTVYQTMDEAITAFEALVPAYHDEDIVRTFTVRQAEYEGFTITFRYDGSFGSALTKDGIDGSSDFDRTIQSSLELSLEDWQDAKYGRGME